MASSSYSSSSTSGSSDTFTPSEWTQQNMLSDLMQQKGLLIGIGAVVLAVLFFRGRSSDSQEQAARHLVRDWRRVDDTEGARDLVGEYLPTVLRPAMLIALEEIERQVQRGFQRLERQIERL